MSQNPGIEEGLAGVLVVRGVLLLFLIALTGINPGQGPVQVQSANPVQESLSQLAVTMQDALVEVCRNLGSNGCSRI